MATQSQTPTTLVNRHRVTEVDPDDPSKAIDPRECPVVIHQNFEEEVTEWGCGYHIYLAFLPIFASGGPAPAPAEIYRQSYAFDPIQTLTSVAASKARLVAIQAESSFGATFPP